MANIQQSKNDKKSLALFSGTCSVVISETISLYAQQMRPTACPMNYEESRRSHLENMHILWQHKSSCHDYEILIHPDPQTAMETTTIK